ncbi:MAG: Sec-independent protein translocase protein TatB [Desulfovibrio sp.]|jgi:sec-independent protein translocase protein TatB|nr:Sec-independent protein translocase protein TatB [Desulfovibrio sp.]
MFGIGGTEFLVIMVVAILVLGPEHLPRIVRICSRVMSDVRKASTDFQRALHFEAERDDLERKKNKSAKKAKTRPAEDSAPDKEQSKAESSAESVTSPEAGTSDETAASADTPASPGTVASAQAVTSPEETVVRTETTSGVEQDAKL